MKVISLICDLRKKFWQLDDSVHILQQGKSLDTIFNQTLALLAQAERLGFSDWFDQESTANKLHEEYNELMDAISSGDQDKIQEEIGDVLFVLLRFAGILHCDFRTALTEANEKCSMRLDYVEHRMSANSFAKKQFFESYWKDSKEFMKRSKKNIEEGKRSKIDSLLSGAKRNKKLTISYNPCLS